MNLLYAVVSSLDPAGWHDGSPGAAVLPQAAAALVLPQGPAVPDHQAAAPGTGHADKYFIIICLGFSVFWSLERGLLQHTTAGLLR